VKEFRVIVLDEDKIVRQKLAEYYRKNLAQQYAPKVKSIVRKAKNISIARQKISEGFINNENIRLVVFSQDFSEIEKAKLRDALSLSQIGVEFVSVKLKPLKVA